MTEKTPTERLGAPKDTNRDCDWLSVYGVRFLKK